MGNPKLRDFLGKAAQPHSLMETAISHRYGGGFQAMRVGIDAGGWLDQACEQRRFRACHNTTLSLLFLQLARLLQFPVIPIFVFNGTYATQNVTHGPLLDQFNRLVGLFGYYSHFAPGDADAELAMMSREGLVDLVMTDNVGVLVFGGLRVVQNFPLVNISNDDLHELTATHIGTHPLISLTRDDLVFVTILCGSCDSPGLPIEILRDLAHGTDLSRQLVIAGRTMDNTTLGNFLCHWRELLRQELQENVSGSLPRCYPQLARSISNTFPNSDVLRHYSQPITSWTAGGSSILASSAACWSVHGPPDVKSLASTAEPLFNWLGRDKKLSMFYSCICPGLCLRKLVTATQDFSHMHSTYSRGFIVDGPLSRSSVLGIICNKTGPYAHSHLNGYVLKIATQAFFNEASSGLKVPDRLRTAQTASCLFRSVWMPAEVVHEALPRLEEAYINADAHELEEDDI